MCRCAGNPAAALLFGFINYGFVESARRLGLTLFRRVVRQFIFEDRKLI
jgi:hypothetical protein